MNQDEIIEMARQAGFFINDELTITSPFIEDICISPMLKEFAKLVAAKHDPKIAIADAYRAGVDSGIAAEREACESIEYDLAKSPAMFATMAEYKSYRDGVEKYRAAIRARGEA
jgi:hypothetical protein